MSTTVVATYLICACCRIVQAKLSVGAWKGTASVGRVRVQGKELDADDRDSNTGQVTKIDYERMGANGAKSRPLGGHTPGFPRYQSVTWGPTGVSRLTQQGYGPAPDLRNRTTLHLNPVPGRLSLRLLELKPR